jgi:hypothetical protein
MVNVLRAWVVVMAIVAMSGGAVAGQALFVSPQGDDANAGTLESPLRTLVRARDAVRERNERMMQDVHVYLRGGRYELEETLVLDGRDGGRNGHRIVYGAYQGEAVSISGGRRIEGWRREEDGSCSAAAAAPGFRQLYVNGRRGVRARWPGAGEFLRVVRWEVENDRQDARERVFRHVEVRAEDAARLAAVEQLAAVEMVINKHWDQSRLRIESYEVDGDRARIVPMARERGQEETMYWPNREPGQVFYFENARAFLEEPGEWYWDAAAERVYYMPRAGEDMEHAEVIAPRLERLLEIRGTVEQPVSGIEFRGLHFEHTTWLRPSEEGRVGMQGGFARGQGFVPPGIYLEHAHRVRFEGNVFRHMGGSGIAFHMGTQANELIGNEISDISGAGIIVYQRLWEHNPPEHEKSRGDIIRHNRITRVGLDYTGSAGILATFTDGLIIENNELSHMPYTAISVGWGWTDKPTALRANAIRRNHIHHVMQLHDDGAGIYTLSRQPGTVIEENYLHDIARSRWAGSYEIAAIYLDEQTSGVTVRNNVIERLEGKDVLPFKENRAGENEVDPAAPDPAVRKTIIDQAGPEPAQSD